MGKRANKRLKTERPPIQGTQPLGSQSATVSLLDDASKDDEERRLESVLFGTTYIPAALNENIFIVSEKENEEVGGGKELQNLLDTDVCFRITRFLYQCIN